MSDKGGRWLTYKVRTCYSMHECALCGISIRFGETYYDGGFGRRAHEECVKGLTFATDPRARDHHRRVRHKGAPMTQDARTFVYQLGWFVVGLLAALDILLGALNDRPAVFAFSLIVMLVSLFVLNESGRRVA